jgi:hypothetical protein
MVERNFKFGDVDLGVIDRYPTLKGHQPVSVTFPSIGPHAPFASGEG